MHQFADHQAGRCGDAGARWASQAMTWEFNRVERLLLQRGMRNSVTAEFSVAGDEARTYVLLGDVAPLTELTGIVLAERVVVSRGEAAAGGAPAGRWRIEYWVRGEHHEFSAEWVSVEEG